MRVTLRDLLRNCRLALKKFLNKRDKWVKEWAGQVSRGWQRQGSTEGVRGSLKGQDRISSVARRRPLAPVLGKGLAPLQAGPLAPAHRPKPHLQGRASPLRGHWHLGPGRG